MPKIELDVGEAVTVTFRGTDGEITVAFSDPHVRVLVGCEKEVAQRCQELGGIVVHADLPDNAGRGDVIYWERLATPEDKGLAFCGICGSTGPEHDDEAHRQREDP